METKFYVIEIATGDNKIAGKAIYEYDTLNEATAIFHKKLGVAMASNLYTSDLVMVIDNNGLTYKIEKYVTDTATETTEA